MSFVESVKKFPLIHLWLIIVFILSGLFVNCLQATLLLLWPINRDVYRRLTAKVTYLLYAELTFMAEWWAGMDLTFYGDVKDFMKIGKEAAILVPNHRGDIDWLVGYILAERAGYLGAAKTYMKNKMKYIPTLGWSWWFSDYCFLKRNWEADQSHILKVLHSLAEYKIPFMLGIFAEGTRFTSEKLKASQEYALSQGIKPLKHHILPRPKGFAVTTQALKDTVSAVYNVEVNFPEQESATLKNLLFGKKIACHLLVKRYDIKDVPTESTKATADWVKKLFIEKDEMYDYFVNNGRFQADVIEYPRKPWNLMVMIGWNILFIGALSFVIRYIIMSGSYILLALLAVAFIMGFILIKFMFSITDSSKGSSFGLKKIQDKQSLDPKKAD